MRYAALTNGLDMHGAYEARLLKTGGRPLTAVIALTR